MDRQMTKKEIYEKEYTVQVHLKLNKKTDRDILDKLATVPKQTYIKAAVREKMGREAE